MPFPQNQYFAFPQVSTASETHKNFLKCRNPNSYIKCSFNGRIIVARKLLHAKMIFASKMSLFAHGGKTYKNLSEFNGFEVEILQIANLLKSVILVKYHFGVYIDAKTIILVEYHFSVKRL